MCLTPIMNVQSGRIFRRNIFSLRRSVELLVPAQLSSPCHRADSEILLLTNVFLLTELQKYQEAFWGLVINTISQTSR